MRWTAARLVVSIALLLAACGGSASASSDTSPTTTGPTVTTTTPVVSAPESVPESCPITLPGHDGFSPAEARPEAPPQSYGLVWYGTPALWTMIPPNGQVRPRPGGDKFFWWSENYEYGEWTPDIGLTAVRMDGTSATVEAGSPGTNGQHPDLGNFMLVGMDIPDPGCWQITAEYKGSSLTYTMWINER